MRVQGTGAAEEISRAIDEFNLMEDVDVLIVGRGGGSAEDLWAFNEEIVARAIHRSRIPVISAVGHEIDWTISDFVADLRAPTPSAAAELVVREKAELERRLEELGTRLEQSLTGRIQFMTADMERVAHRFRLRHPAILIEKMSADLEKIRHRFTLRHPANVIERNQQRIDDLVRLMSVRLSHFLDLKGKEFEMLAEKVSVLNPLNVLVRGYSVTLSVPGGKVIKDAGILSAGDEIKTVLAKGSVVSSVKKIDQKGG